MGKIFWDVDTQYDFMKEDGALSVPGAEEIIPKLKEVNDYAKENNYKVLGSVDAHDKADEELERNGGPFPAHCMRGSEGQKKIEATEPSEPLFVPSSEEISVESMEEHLSKGNEVYFEKQDYDVFTNRNLERFLSESDVDSAIVYGVTTEFCVKAAALGMNELGMDVYVLEDAVKSMDEEEGKVAVSEMKAKGIEFYPLEEAKEKVLEVEK